MILGKKEKAKKNYTTGDKKRPFLFASGKFSYSVTMISCCHAVKKNKLPCKKGKCIFKLTSCQSVWVKSVENIYNPGNE
jgi:hypothetical protein